MIRFCGTVQQRYVVVAMMFLSLAFSFLLRMSFPIVLTQIVYIPNINSSSDIGSTANKEIICPVKYHMIENASDPNPVASLMQHSDKILKHLHDCHISRPIRSHWNSSVNEIAQVLDNSKRYQWSQQLQGMILSSFNWGSLLGEIPGAILVQRVGPKLVLLTSIALSALVTLLTPLSIEYGDSYGLITTRVILGLVQAPVFSALGAFVVPWYPAEERGRLCSIGYIGISAGGALASYIFGLLLHHIGRWDIVFYFVAATLVLWWILFALICYEQPANHPFISDSEKLYLQRKIEDYEKERNALPSTPWKSIFESAPVLALSFSTGLYAWSFYIINNDLPKYLNDVLHVSIKKNGIYSSFPKILSIVVSTGSGFVGDLMLTKCQCDRTCVRKMFVVLTSIIPAIFLMCASYAGCDELLAVIFLTVAISAHGFNSAGAAINLYDLSPNYAAALSGIINFFATVVSISAPYIAGLLTPNALLTEWRLVFWITFCLHVLEVVIFTSFGSAKTQTWNSLKD